MNRLLFGSEAENILKASRLPVLIVGPKAAFAPTEKFVFRFITCGITLDEHGADVALYAKHLADEQERSSKWFSLPFYEAGQEVDGYWAFKNRVQNLVSEEAAKTLSPVVLSEPPTESLAELAVAREADLVVFDQRGRFLNPHLGSCVLTDVLATAPCPVLAIPFVK